jgi:hypothetical protein
MVHLSSPMHSRCRRRLERESDSRSTPPMMPHAARLSRRDELELRPLVAQQLMVWLTGAKLTEADSMSLGL